MAELKDGSLLAMMRTTLGKIYRSASKDRGETWSDGEATELPSPSAANCIKRIPETGDLVFLWNNATPEALAVPGGRSYHYPRNPLTAAISKDEGKTWTNLKDVERREGYISGYPSVSFVDGEALVAYYHSSRSMSRDTDLRLKILTWTGSIREEVVMTRTSRRSLLTAVTAAWAAGSRQEAWGLAAAALESPLAGNELAHKLLQMSDAQLARLEEARQKGLLELAPVNLPTPDRYSGDNDHFGWPVATMVDDTLIVSHRRNLGHKKAASQEQDETSSYSVVVRSQDGGKTWSDPYDLRDCMRPEDRSRGGFTPLSHRYKFNLKQDPFLGYKLHLIAIGTTKDRGVVIISDHGVFRSDDKGKTWRHFSKAFRDDTMPGPILYTAPRLFEHPEYGLVLLAHSMPNRYPHHIKHAGALTIADTLHIRYSRDGGETWQSLDVAMPEWAQAQRALSALLGGQAHRHNSKLGRTVERCRRQHAVRATVV